MIDEPELLSEPSQHESPQLPPSSPFPSPPSSPLSDFHAIESVAELHLPVLRLDNKTRVESLQEECVSHCSRVAARVTVPPPTPESLTKSSIKSFFPRISKDQLDEQQRKEWDILAEDRESRVEEEEQLKETRATEKREYDRLCQQKYQAGKRKAEVDGQGCDDKGKGRNIKVKSFF